MKCYSVELGRLLKVTMLGRSVFTLQNRHITRRTSEYILYIITKGKLSVFVDGEELTLFEGDVYFFDKGCYQAPSTPTECEFYFVHFDVDGVSAQEMDDEEYYDTILARKANFLKADIFSAKSYDYVGALVKQSFHIGEKSLLDRLIGICKNNTISYGNNVPTWRISVSGAVAELLMRLEDLTFAALGRGYTTKNGCVYDNVRRIVDFVEKHYTENFGSEDIERELLINFDYANRIFKRHIGYSIIRYRNHLRINTAKTLLDGMQGGMTMNLIAEQIGFGNRYYFSRYFKQCVGISPEEYRAKAEKG
ncbi:MAG: helix-turn-helix domain-containing protein [Clostridia bacterium]|nr:helix-turn-helix domain-containing protein [Clostridia bacterium]